MHAYDISHKAICESCSNHQLCVAPNECVCPTGLNGTDCTIGRKKFSCKMNSVLTVIITKLLIQTLMNARRTMVGVIISATTHMDHMSVVVNNSMHLASMD